MQLYFLFQRQLLVPVDIFVAGNKILSTGGKHYLTSGRRRLAMLTKFSIIIYQQFKILTGMRYTGVTQR